MMNDARPGYEELVQMVKDLKEEKRKRNQVEEQLRTNENKYRTLIENLPQKIFLKDKHSVYISCNENYARDLKIKLDDIAGKNDYDFWPKELADKYTADDKRILEVGQTEYIEERYIQNGKEGFVQTVKVPVRDEKGDVTGVLGIFWDITERKQIEEELLKYRDQLELMVNKRTVELHEANTHLQQEIAEHKKAEEKAQRLVTLVQQEKDRLLALVNSINDEVWFADTQKNFILLNPMVRQRFGLPPDKGINVESLASDLEIYRADGSIRPVEESPALRALKGEVVENLEEIIRIPKTGELRYRSVNSSPVKGAGGNIIGSVSIVHDITERKRVEEALRESEKRLRRFYESVMIGVIFFNMKGLITDANDKFLELIGYTREELNDGKVSWSNLTPPEYWFLDEKSREELKATGVNKIPFEKEFIRKDGKRIPIIIAGAMLENDLFNGVGFVLDITERKQFEKALSESECRIRALNDQILNMLMVVSHDLRSPLISVEATLKLLMRGVYGPMDASVKNTIVDLHVRIEKLLAAAEDCLGKVSGAAGEVNFTRDILDLREDIIDPVLNEFSEEMEKQKIVIDNRLGAIPAKKIPIKADKVWLKIVFRNLFSNAIKYGGRGCVVAFGFEECGSYYKLNVYNSGAPVLEDFREKLFDKFYRSSKGSLLAPEGMGLGLYLSKEIIKKHGGDIWYEPKEWGSNFVLTLPHD